MLSSLKTFSKVISVQFKCGLPSKVTSSSYLFQKNDILTAPIRRKKSTMKFQKVTHVIFDLDGLLIESESIYDRIVQEIVEPQGKTYTKDVKLKVLGTPEQDTASIIVRELQLPMTVEEFLDVYRVKVNEQLQNPLLLPGARDLIQHLSKHDVPIAIATSSSEDAMLLKTKNYRDLFQLFHHIVSGGSDPEVKNGKPAPDIYLVCASRFPDKPDPKKCLVFEDAPNGVVGASIAGMQTVMVPPPEVTQEQKEKASIALKSLEDFDPELFGLPARDSK